MSSPSSVMARPDTDTKVLRTLQVGAAGCFIGHGAFGIITKAGWLPYFGVAGIAPATAWHLMPPIGVMDVALGISALLWPMRISFLWMAFWAAFTALLRPLAGEPFWEALERAGNYGVPLALFVAARTPNLFARLHPQQNRWDNRVREIVALVLRLTTATLLIGHAGLGLFVKKELLTRHYEAAGLSHAAALTPVIGLFEFFLAVLVLVRPRRRLLLAICAWKIGCESLFLVQGAPVWEFVERFGSYTAPLALAFLLTKPLSQNRPLSFPATVAS